jgi:hypothetical protein
VNRPSLAESYAPTTPRTIRRPRPRARVLVARWLLVLSLAAVLAASVAAALGAIPLPGAASAPAAHPCVVVGHAITDHAVLCADGTSRPDGGSL